MANLTRRRFPISDMRREIDRVFEGFLPPAQDGDGEARSAVWSPRVDVAETDDAYQMHMDLPGINKDQLEINYHERTLSVSGERQMEEAAEGTSFSRIERAYGRFYRSFTLPEAANADEIEAHYENGVLAIRIPKTPESQPRRIEIN